MKIGIIGTGHVGGALGRLWAAKGHEILFGSRDPHSARVQSLAAEAGATARAGTIAEAGAYGPIVVLATPWSGTRVAVEEAGLAAGTILIDATNPLQPGLAGLELGTTTSAGEEVARWAPGARVVKAFNTLGAAHFANPIFDGAPTSMFLCGDDAEAKAVAADLAAELGFEAVDAGPLSNARWTEALAMLWIDLTHVRKVGPIAFKLVRKGGTASG